MAPEYLDFAATTPVDRLVAEVVVQAMTEEFGNAGSRTHASGQRARNLVESSRRLIADSLWSDPGDIVFTSGATEASNLAILGLVEFASSSGRRHIVSTAIEHKATLEPLARLSRLGFEIELVDPADDGRVNPETILRSVRQDTLLVSIMHVNNETGVVQPISEVASELPDPVYLHIDAAQSFGKGSLTQDLCNRRIDLISLSAHKVFGPKGIGCLVSRRRNRTRPKLTPLQVGGGQERGLRPGTQAVPLIAGFGEATRLAIEDASVRTNRLHAFGSRLEAALTNHGALINGTAPRAPHILNVSIAGLDSEAAMLVLKPAAEISNGSACNSDRYEPSHVLIAMGFDSRRVQEAIRFSWSHESDPNAISAIDSLLRRR